MCKGEKYDGPSIKQNQNDHSDLFDAYVPIDIVYSPECIKSMAVPQCNDKQSWASNTSPDCYTLMLNN